MEVKFGYFEVDVAEFLDNWRLENGFETVKSYSKSIDGPLDSPFQRRPPMRQRVIKKYLSIYV